MADALLSPPPAIDTSIPLEFVTGLCVHICNRIIAQNLKLTIDYKQAQQIMQKDVAQWQASHLPVGLVHVTDLGKPWPPILDETSLLPGNLFIDLISNPN